MSGEFADKAVDEMNKRISRLKYENECLVQALKKHGFRIAFSDGEGWKTFPLVVSEMREDLDQINVPWKKRRAELEPENAHWSDYAAFEEWANDLLDRPCIVGNVSGCGCFNCHLHFWWEEMDYIQKIGIYQIVWKVAESVDVQFKESEATDESR